MLRELHYGVTEQAKAGKHRLDDAKSLLAANRWRGAMYLAGYSIECLLKSKLMKRFSCRHLKELEQELRRKQILPSELTVFTHQLELLLRLTDGLDRLRMNTELWRVFNRVNRWVPAWRYTADLSNRDDASEFLLAVERLSQWIENSV